MKYTDRIIDNNNKKKHRGRISRENFHIFEDVFSLLVFLISLVLNLKNEKNVNMDKDLNKHLLNKASCSNLVSLSEKPKKAQSLYRFRKRQLEIEKGKLNEI